MNTMNTCEEYREAIAAEPSFDGGAAHLSQCASCQAFRAEMLALDLKISSALAISVPELKLPELPELDTSKVTAMPLRRFAQPAWLAVAATVTLAAFIGFGMFGSDVSNATLAEQILVHIDHEPGAFRVVDEAVTDKRLARVVPANIATLNHSAGLITYARSCLINGREVPHLVIQGEFGPITILLMPGEKITGAQTIEGENVHGIILPVGDGSIAIIGEVGEHLERIEKQVMNSVTWST
ncbi:MAG: DUF3379 family protein [Proteobacteria bacterium]|nr:DUF3379 family protein [Pseudomonadota bacterium]